MGNHPGRKLAQQDRRVRTGNRSCPAVALFIHAIRTAGARHHLPGREPRPSCRRCDLRIKPALPNLRARPAGRRLGGALCDGLRHARGGSSPRDRQRGCGRDPAAGGGRGNDRAFAALPLADRHGTGLFRGLRHAGDHRHDLVALSGAGPAGGFAALCGAPLQVVADGAAGADRHLCRRRHSRRHRRAAVAGANHFRRLLAAV